MLRTYDVAKSSQLANGEHSALTKATQMTMDGTMMAVHAERRIAPTAPTDPELQWVANDVLNILDHDTML